ncbi:tropomyosin-2-like [Chanodichthys erythropterus]|uniref:tropomyosin-2-like n=1 Tax=Chanodichthys erythropterus TaxID=933992 RepID=UPI00351F42FE
MEMVQLRETVLKQEQSDSCHTELKQNTEHLTQRLTALTQQMRKLQKEKDSYQCELTALRLQLQDREQSTLEMRQQLREIQEERETESTEIQTLKEQLREIQEERETESNEIQTLKEQLREIQEKREMENSEIQALKEQLRELLLARKEPEQTHRAQTMPSTPKLSNTRSQHPPLCAERPNPDSSQPSQRPLSVSPVPAQQHQPSSHSRPAPTSTEEAEIALLIDSNGKFIDTKKLFPRHKAVKFWCPTTDKALELLTESQLGRPSHIIIHTGTNDLRSQQDRVSDSLRAVMEKARKTFPN